MTRHRSTPPALRESGAPRILVAVAVLVVYGVMDRVFMKPYLEGLGLHGSSRVVVSAVLIGMALLPLLAVLMSTYTTDWSLAAIKHPKRTAWVGTLAVGWLLVQVLGSGQRIPVVETPIGFLALLTAVWVGIHRHALRSQTVHRRRLLRLENIPDADRMIGVCRRDLEDASLTGDERVVVQLNLADALVTLSRRGDHGDGLPEATERLEQIIAAGHPGWTFAAAERLVRAMAVKAERSGDLEGYDYALEVLAGAADAAATAGDIPGAPRRAHTIGVESLSALSEHAASEGDARRWKELHDRARSDDPGEREGAAKQRRLRAEQAIAYAGTAGANPLEADLGASITSCRQALQRLVLASWDAQAKGLLTLADLLALRAVLEPRDRLDALADARHLRHAVPSRAARDRTGALLLCMLLIFMFRLTPDARRRIPDLLVLLRLQHVRFLPRLGSRWVTKRYGQIYHEQADASPATSVAVAAQWARWAAHRAAAGTSRNASEVSAAAEAHWCWIRAVVADGRRRAALDGRQQRLSRVQGQAGQACRWLIEAKRLQDAVLVLELGRAVLLTERMSRDRRGIDERLLAAGRGDLAERWHAVCARMMQADRAPFQPATDAPTPRTGGSDSTSRAALASAEYLALADHEQLLREISQVDGCGDVDAPLNYDDLRAASRDGPLVYLSTTERDGLALVVTDTADPQLIELPELTVGALRDKAGLLLDPRVVDDPEMAARLGAELLKLLPWLWDALMAPLISSLEAGSTVTLVAGGLLGQLPLAAACAVQDSGGFWHDQTPGLVFRNAPNARVLLRARDVTLKLDPTEPSVASIAVPTSSEAGRLRWAQPESMGVGRRFGEQRTERPSAASVDAVLAALERCEIWHFACHGRHDADDPLESRLFLAEDSITLRHVFSRPWVPHRLAVLAACQSAVADATQLDEVVSFPSALLQAGVAGVVCAHVTVFDSEAAMLLVLRFFDLLCEGRQPARALGEAQAWLRNATSAEIHRALPATYAAPLAGTAGHRPFSHPDAWATLAYSGA